MTKSPASTSPVATPLNAEAFQAIGSLFIAAAVGETLLSEQLMRLSRQPDFALIHPVVSGMEAAVKIGLIRTLCAQRQEWAMPEVNAACDKIRNAYAKRNVFAHSAIEPEMSRGRLVVQPTRYSASGALPQKQYYTPKQINGFSREIARSLSFLDNLLLRIGVPTLEELQQPTRRSLKAKRTATVL